MHHDHGHHQHAFADPAKVAAKFNSADRDKWQMPGEIVAALNIGVGATVADIGAGTGYMVAHLSKAVGSSGTVLAIDTSDAMVEFLANRREELRPATIRPQRASHDDPHLSEESVDAILVLDAWHHIVERAQYARQVYAGLKHGGRLVVVEADIEAEIGPPREMRIAPEQMASDLAAACFRTQVARESMPRHYMIVAHKD